MRIGRINMAQKNTDPELVDLELIDSLIRKYKGKKGNMIPLLQGTQEIYGYLPRVAFEKIASETD